MNPPKVKWGVSKKSLSLHYLLHTLNVTYISNVGFCRFERHPSHMNGHVRVETRTHPVSTPSSTKSWNNRKENVKILTKKLFQNTRVTWRVGFPPTKNPNLPVRRKTKLELFITLLHSRYWGIEKCLVPFVASSYHFKLPQMLLSIRIRDKFEHRCMPGGPHHKGYSIINSMLYVNILFYILNKLFILDTRQYKCTGAM